MPKIEKQIPEATTSNRVSAKKIQRSPRQSVWDRVVPIQSLKRGIKIVLYGRTKTGKTTIASSFPKPMLILGTEDGTASISDVEGIDFLHIQRSSDISDAVERIYSSGYRSTILDHASGLQDIMLREVLGLDEVPVNKTWGMANNDDWNATAAQMKEKLYEVLTLATKGVCDVVILAHEKDISKNFKDDDSRVSDVMIPHIAPQVQPAVIGWLCGQADYIGHTFIREGVKKIKKASKRTDKEGKPIIKEVTIQTGNKEYCLRVGPHNVYATGFRKPTFISLPESIVDPTYDKIMSLINGNTVS